MRILIVVLLTLVASKSWAAPPAESATDIVRLNADTTLAFASPAEAKVILLADDDVSRRLSRFDLQSRLQTSQPVTRNDWKGLVREQVAEWTPAEREQVQQAFAGLQDKLARYRLRLPPQVLLIKTTGKEEADAAYTRAHAIVLPAKVLRYGSPQFENLLLHELFHVLSRNDPAVRRELYKIIGFTVRDEITLPPSLESRRITNPDAPQLDAFIELKNDQQQVTAVPILYATPKDYDAKAGGSFFRYATFRLLVVDQVEGKWQPRLKDGQPVVLDPAKVENFREQIGNNTNYILHPDEILADNFVHLVQGAKNLPTPRIVEQMSKVLSP
jgi:hypothetical protein